MSDDHHAQHPHPADLGGHAPREVARHDWIEDGEAFAVIEDDTVLPDVFGLPSIQLEGRRFPHTYADSGEAPLGREILRLAAPPKPCVWTQQDHIDGETWEPSCTEGGAFRLDWGSPSENNMKHCCFCGRPLEEQLFWTDERDEDGLTDAEADAQTLEGVYGPEE